MAPERMHVNNEARVANAMEQQVEVQRQTLIVLQQIALLMQASLTSAQEAVKMQASGVAESLELMKHLTPDATSEVKPGMKVG